MVISAVGNAFAILTDPEKRKQYDLYGSDEERLQQSQRHSHGAYRGYSRGFEGNPVYRNGIITYNYNYITLSISYAKGKNRFNENRNNRKMVK